MKISKVFLFSFLFFIFYLILAIFYSYNLKIGDIYVTTYDEARYYYASSDIVSDYYSGNYKALFSNYYKYSQSIHFMHYYVLAFFRIVFNESFLAWLIFQISCYILACIYFSKIFTLYGYNKNYEIFSFILLAINAPLLFYVFSLMRDIQIFLLMTLCIFFYKKNYILPLVIFFAILLTYRINAAFSIVIYVLCDYFIQIKQNIKFKFSYVLYVILVIFIIILFNEFSNGSMQNLFYNKLENVKLNNFLFDSIKLIFSPLPWSLDNSLPSYLKVWYVNSFIFTIILFVCLIGKNYKDIIPLPLVVLVLFNILVYSTEAGVGIRQSVMLLPWLVIPSVLYVIKFYNEKNS